VATKREQTVSARSLLRDVLRKCILAFLIATGLSLVVTASSLVLPIYTMQIFSKVLMSHSTATLVVLTVIAVIGVVFGAMLRYLRSRIQQIVSTWVARRISLDTLQSLVLASLQRRGDPGQALRDINELRQFISGPSLITLMELVWTPLIWVIVFLLHPAYAMIGLTSVLLFVLVAVINEWYTRRPISEANESAVLAFNEFGAALRNAEVIEAMGLINNISRRWRASFERTLTQSTIGNLRLSLINAITGSLHLIEQICIAAVGMYIVILEQANMASVIGAMMLMRIAVGPIDQLIKGWRQWINVRDTYARVSAMLDNARDERAEMRMPVPNGTLEVDRVVFMPPGLSRPVLRGVSFKLEPGESVGILGPSGAGKSTLARLMVGLWRPTAGAIRLDGNDVYLWSRDSFGQYVGYLPQSVGLFEATIRDNIGRLGEADPAAVVAAAKAANCHDMIGGLPQGYETEVGDNSYLLTGGQRQRIALARALFGSPRLLVLDEPDASLDFAGEAALLRAIQEAKANGVIVVVVTHRRVLLDALDKLVVLRDGGIEKFGWRRDILPTLSAPNAAGVAHQSSGVARIGQNKVS
jgi:ATP-binding cassette, subfamily C, bacterial